MPGRWVKYSNKQIRELEYEVRHAPKASGADAHWLQEVWSAVAVKDFQLLRDLLDGASQLVDPDAPALYQRRLRITDATMKSVPSDGLDDWDADYSLNIRVERER